MFELTLKTLYRYMKLRFLIIGLLIIVFTPLFSYYLPLSPNFEPAYSIYSDSDLGSSQLLTKLNQYNIHRSYRGNLTSDINYDLIIVETPQRLPSSDYFSQLIDKYRSGSKILLIGSKNLEQLFNDFGAHLDGDPTGDFRIFDENNNGGEIVYPELQGFGNSSYYGVVPTSINFEYSPLATITTKPTAAYASCWDAKKPCTKQYTVGGVFDDFAIIADQFMFKNGFTTEFPQNLDLFSQIVNHLIGNSGNILFEESYLNWAPLNRKGVENFVDVRLNVNMIVFLISLLAIGLPTIIGFQSNVFGSEPVTKRKFRQYSDLEQRLAYIHIERLPAAPLNLLEQTLMEENLRFHHRGKYFFQYVAADLLDYVKKHNMSLPEFHILQLQDMMNGIYSHKSSWKIINEVYDFIITNELYKKEGKLL